MIQNSTTSKITIHMVSSLDGFIAKKDNSMNWFETSNHYEKGVEYTGEEIKAFQQTIDCYVMGAATYRHAAELSKNYGWPYGDVPTFVLSHKSLQATRPQIRMLSGELTQIVKEQLQPAYKNIWVVGGAKLVRDFIRLQLAAEIRLSVLPVILGEGLALFDDMKEQALNLKEVTAYKTGMVELRYELKPQG